MTNSQASQPPSSISKTACYWVSAVLIIGLSAAVLYFVYPAMRRNISVIVFGACVLTVACSVVWGWWNWTDEKKTAFEVLGPILLTCIAAAGMAAFLLFNQRAHENFRYFVVLASLTWTVFYVFLFIIVPQFEEHQGLRGRGPKLLGFSLIFSVVMTVILFSIYFDMTFLGRNFEKYNGSHPLYVEEAFSAVSPEQFFRVFMEIIQRFHFFIFILSFVAVDLVFVKYSPKPLATRKFRRLVIVVDIPMMTAAFGTVWAKHFMPDNAFEETFEAGAIAFQLVSGSVAAYLLDNLQRVTWCFRHCRESASRCIQKRTG